MSTTGKTLNPIIMTQHRHLAVTIITHNLTTHKTTRKLNIHRRTVEQYKAEMRAEASR